MNDKGTKDNPDITPEKPPKTYPPTRIEPGQELPG